VEISVRGWVDLRVEECKEAKNYVQQHRITLAHTACVFDLSDFEYVSVGVGRDSSVGIATRNGLDSPGMESRWG
jgi:hypothetical protein